jgi:hypothetical protein
MRIIKETYRIATIRATVATLHCYAILLSDRAETKQKKIDEMKSSVKITLDSLSEVKLPKTNTN